MNITSKHFKELTGGLFVLLLLVFFGKWYFWCWIIAIVITFLALLCASEKARTTNDEVRFEDLTPEQKEKLERFIRNLDAAGGSLTPMPTPPVKPQKQETLKSQPSIPLPPHIARPYTPEEIKESYLYTYNKAFGGFVVELIVTGGPERPEEKFAAVFVACLPGDKISPEPAIQHFIKTHSVIRSRVVTKEVKVAGGDRRTTVYTITVKD